ncbi:translation initiation factor-like protein IF-2 [Phaeosphaeria sp. MPI-PUGE-AT-0046c]|nr:translation initiation factor-like protein IF-2 [Phaeosphaeria sp. MPI-PUGE-AT-0046c]
MKRARGLRVSSPRDICVFCATRQLAAAEALSSRPFTPQRRYLNSSSRAPQSADAIYKDADERPTRPMTQAERMRQQLQASGPYYPPPSAPSQGGFRSPAERMRASLGNAQPQQPRTPQRDSLPIERRASTRNGVWEGFGRNDGRERSAPMNRRDGGSARTTTWVPPASQNRHRVNMDSRPQMDSPAFGSSQLRRRNQPRDDRGRFDAFDAEVPKKPTPAPMTRPPPQRRMLDEAELSKLLNPTSQPRQTVTYQPFARDTDRKRMCFHCNSTAHLSHDCPSKPMLRDRHPPRHEPQSASLADAAMQWRQKVGDGMEYNRPPTVQEEADKRTRFGSREDRLRSKFDIEEPMETKNRYEQPERRRGGQGRSRRMARDEDDEQDDKVVDRAERKRLRQEAKKAAQMARAAPIPISLPQFISVANLASMLKLRTEDFVVKLEELGFEEVQNDHILNAEHAGLIAQEYNYEPVFVAEEEDGDLYPAEEIAPEEYVKLPARPPVVTIMGHVDHGKTTILDFMRSTSVAATEFGGITQHIGAFSVPLGNGKKITFLDTPGHSAFETMRARGANVTDIVVLVVAADDSVMPQTVEAIKHAQAAKVPIIVAINKIDKSQADPDAVKLDLGRHGIEIEDFGGDVQAICVSGKTGQGIPDLEEAISTLSETLDHRADPDTAVEGWVLEGSTKKSGRVATVLVRSGTLRQGTALVAGTTWTRVRTLRNEAGVVVPEAGPGIAVEVDGWRDQPIAGDEVLQASDEQHASSVTELRTEKVEREQLARDMDAINSSRRLEAERREAEGAAEKALAEGVDETDASSAAVEEAKPQGPEIVNFIIKGAGSGSVEAVIDSVSSLGNAEVSARILRFGVGSPSEFDIAHASSASGHIINFNTPIPPNISRLAEEKNVKIVDNNIIYRVVEQVKSMLEEKLRPEIIQRVTGEAEVAAVFEIGIGGKKKLRVAGSKVRNGQVERGTKVRVLRGAEAVYTGTITSLKSQKKDVDTMRKDTECGIAFEAWEEFKPGDKIQCFEEREEKRTL